MPCWDHKKAALRACRAVRGKKRGKISRILPPFLLFILRFLPRPPRPEAPLAVDAPQPFGSLLVKPLLYPVRVLLWYSVRVSD